MTKIAVNQSDWKDLCSSFSFFSIFLNQRPAAKKKMKMNTTKMKGKILRMRKDRKHNSHSFHFLCGAHSFHFSSSSLFLLHLLLCLEFVFLRFSFDFFCVSRIWMQCHLLCFACIPLYIRIFQALQPLFSTSRSFSLQFSCVFFCRIVTFFLSLSPSEATFNLNNDCFAVGEKKFFVRLFSKHQWSAHSFRCETRTKVAAVDDDTVEQVPRNEETKTTMRSVQQLQCIKVRLNSMHGVATLKFFFSPLSWMKNADNVEYPVAINFSQWKMATLQLNRVVCVCANGYDLTNNIPFRYSRYQQCKSYILHRTFSPSRSACKAFRSFFLHLQIKNW